MRRVIGEERRGGGGEERWIVGSESRELSDRSYMVGFCGKNVS